MKVVQILPLLMFCFSAAAETELTTSPSVPVESAPPIISSATRDIITSGKKPYKFSFFSLASIRTVDAEKGGSSIGAYNYLGLSYRLDKDSQVGFRYVFYYDTPGAKFNPALRKEQQVTHQTEIGDPYVSYSRYSLWRGGDWRLSGGARVYFPASRFSQAAKTVAQIRGEVFLDHPIGKYSNFNYGVKADYYIQSQKAMLDDEVPRRNDGSIDFYAVRGTKIAAIEHYIEMDGSLSKSLSLKPRLGFDEEWTNESEENGIEARHKTEFIAQMGTEYRVLRNLSFTLALEETVALTNLREPVTFGRAENYKWVFLSYFSY